MLHHRHAGVALVALADTSWIAEDEGPNGSFTLVLVTFCVTEEFLVRNPSGGLSSSEINRSVGLAPLPNWPKTNWVCKRILEILTPIG